MPCILKLECVKLWICWEITYDLFASTTNIN